MTVVSKLLSMKQGDPFNPYTIPGTNWLMTIVQHLNNAAALGRGEEPNELWEDPSIFFFEMRAPDGAGGSEQAAAYKGPRMIATHLPLTYFKQQIEKYPELKVIQTIRNPKDTLVSYYHFYGKDEALGGFNGSWNDFFKIIENDKLAYGDYFAYHVEWYPFNNQRQNSLVLLYEDMKGDLRSNIKKIAEFLNKDVSEEIIDIVTTKNTFGNIATKSHFMRKGKIGDWKDYFNEEQNELIEQKCKETLQPLGLQFTFD